MIVRFILALAAAAAIIACGDASRQPAVATTICKIGELPQQYEQKTVVVRALARTDGVERTVLVDPECVEVGVAASWPVEPSGSVKSFVMMLRSNNPARISITATFTGKFVWSKAGRPERRIVLEDVRGMSVNRE